MPPPYPAITRRTLCYFCYASAHEERWRSNLDLIAPYLGQFAARHLVIAIDDLHGGLRSGIVSEISAWSTIKCIPNTPALREYWSWHHLLSTHLDADPSHAILYAHAKGASRPLSTPAGRGSWCWTQVMARSLLASPETVGQLFLRHHLVGSMRRTRPHWIPGRPRVMLPWMYPGSWYWLRSSEWHRRPWQQLQVTGYTTEAAPGLLYLAEEGAAILGEAPGLLYQERTWLDHPIYREFLDGPPSRER